METRDPALTKTPVTEQLDTQSDEQVAVNNTHGAKAEALRTEAHVTNHDELEEETTVNKGTDTFEEGVVESEHVNDNDNPARQPDRRDQKGNPFDDGINERNMGSDDQDSNAITEMNRYASIDNAQTRVLNPDLKD